jgi:hypothetical protein
VTSSPSDPSQSDFLPLNDQPSGSETNETATAEENFSDTKFFRLSPLIRITLLALYVALTLPLPFLADMTQAPVPPWSLAVGLALGAIALYAALCERVITSDRGIQVTYPTWVPRFFRKGWSVDWAEIQALKPRTTGQGGIVYYFLSQDGKAYLLPMRIAGFAQMVRLVEAKTGIDTTDVRPLAQPWMYLILLVLTLFLLAIDGWTIATVLGQPPI